MGQRSSNEDLGMLVFFFRLGAILCSVRRANRRDMPCVMRRAAGKASELKCGKRNNELVRRSDRPARPAAAALRKTTVTQAMWSEGAVS